MAVERENKPGGLKKGVAFVICLAVGYVAGHYIVGLVSGGGDAPGAKHTLLQTVSIGGTEIRVPRPSASSVAPIPDSPDPDIAVRLSYIAHSGRDAFTAYALSEFTLLTGDMGQREFREWRRMMGALLGTMSREDVKTSLETVAGGMTTTLEYKGFEIIEDSDDRMVLRTLSTTTHEGKAMTVVNVEIMLPIRKRLVRLVAAAISPVGRPVPDALKAGLAWQREIVEKNP